MPFQRLASCSTSQQTEKGSTPAEKTAIKNPLQDRENQLILPKYSESS